MFMALIPMKGIQKRITYSFLESILVVCLTMPNEKCFDVSPTQVELHELCFCFYILRTNDLE